ncbi:MAG: tetratricopeptide repeat protein [Candidatus Shapirobacteria bacterium]|jgi:tetratricopeptide (TPR) repeat protein
MSQKRLKRIKRAEVLKIVDRPVESFLGIRGIIKENWKFLLALCVGVFLLYFNSLNGNFVSDDYAAITQNSNVKDLSILFSSFRSSPSVINAIIAMIFGVGSSFPFHFANTALYLLSILLFFIFANISFGKNVAKISVLMFSVLPVHVEAVSWISGKPYLLNAIGMFALLLFFAAYDATKNKKYLYYFFAFLPVATYFEPVRSLAIFLILPIYVLTLSKNISKGLFIKWYLILIFLVGSILFLMLKNDIFNRINEVNSGTNGSGEIFYNPLFQYPTAAAKYLQIALFPADLTLYHTMYIFPVWLNWSILITYLVSLVYFFWKNKKIFFCLAFIFAATASSMAPIKVSWLVAERYIFLGSTGVALLLGYLFDSIIDGFVKLGPFFLVVILSVYSIRTFYRNIDWQTNHNLWVNTCQVSPNSHNAWNNIGDDYDKLGQYDNAVRGFTQSVLVKPNYADAYHNRANIFFKTGRLDLARESYQTALSLNPAMFQTYLSLTQIDLTEKRIDLALVHAKKIVELQPNSLQAIYVMGVVQAEAGNNEEAKKIFNYILQAVPNYSPAREALNKL